MEKSCHAHILMASVTRREAGKGDIPGTCFFGGEPEWNWMELVESQLTYRPKREVYQHSVEDKWRTTRPYSAEYKEDSTEENAHEMVLCIGGTPSDLTSPGGTWGEKCTENENGHDAVPSYSDD